MSYFMKIRPVGADLFHVDKQTDMKKLLTVADFLNFADEPKNENFCTIYEGGYSFLLEIGIGEPVRSQIHNYTTGIFFC